MLPAGFHSSVGALQSNAGTCGERGGAHLKQGTFYPELTLGSGALSYNRRAELQQFLVAVVRRRNVSLHVANLWNAVYFNYDLAYGGFRADQLEQKRIPTRTSLARDFSLPIGGFVRVHTETACGDLLAEVVYKEGAHPEVDGGWADPALSGAPADVRDEVGSQPVSVVRERFVLDLAAFGPDGNAVSAKQYERICRRALWLDGHGHLLMEAMYGPEEAELDDLDYYADYLLREHRDGLLAFCFSEDLSDEELREALLRSFEAVRELAASADELRGWRDKYFFLSTDYRRRLADGGALGGGDLRSLYTGLTRLPNGQSRCYSPLGPRILELLERDGYTAEEEALVRGCAYSAAICHANTYVSDTLAREQAGDGVLETGVHVRLDDDWQSGAIWRAERVADPDRYAFATVSPLVPLGLGYSEAGGLVEETFAADEQPVAASQTGFRVALTLRDRALGRLRLSAEAAGVLAPGAVDVVVRHAETRERTVVEREGATLYGIEWPWEFHPGIILTANVESQGSVVRVRSTPVTPPQVASDGTSFDYETNLGVYERELGLTELSPGERRGVPTLTELINRAFRLRGRERPDGARALTLSGVATIVLGPAWRPGETRPIAATLAAMGLERDGADYLWRPRVTAATRSLDRSLLSAYGEASPRGRLARAVRRHWVPMHIRRYDQWSGKSPSAQKRATYAEARRRHKMHGVLPEQLPDDCTWVAPYDWGGDDGAPLIADAAEPGNGNEVLETLGGLAVEAAS